MNKMICTIFCLSFIFVNVYAIQAFTSPKSPYTIKLQNRSITPEPGIEEALIEKLKLGRTFPVYGIVQFKGKLIKKDRFFLRSAGIHPLQYLGSISYLTEFKEGADINKALHLIRWAGHLLPQDKVQKSLWSGSIKEWAQTKDGKVKILVMFYKTVSFAKAEKILKGYTSVFRYRSTPNAWAVELRPEIIKDLAKKEEVKWIELGPLPFIPLGK